MATFVSGFVVGFTAVWQLGLVTLAVVPLIAVIGGIHTTTLAKLSGKSQEALSQAGNIVEQVNKNGICSLFLCAFDFSDMLETKIKTWLTGIFCFLHLGNADSKQTYRR